MLGLAATAQVTASTGGPITVSVSGIVYVPTPGMTTPFTEDCALTTTTEGYLQRSRDVFAACDNFRLTINTEKMVFVHQPPPNTAYNAPCINVYGTQLQAVDPFTYLAKTSPAAPKSMMMWPTGTTKPAKPSVTCRKSPGVVAVSPPQHQVQDV
ncbi:unnamed protein product [Schistocephalus solidus]|uniref:Secreted protein n=1 Tax=Schistocephalus solidus TaxID=70667 RepID=A0A183SHA4_SCHSO|nr:unnamed protein product [Schistocephalus solidus]